MGVGRAGVASLAVRSARNRYRGCFATEAAARCTAMDTANVATVPADTVKDRSNPSSRVATAVSGMGTRTVIRTPPPVPRTSRAIAAAVEGLEPRKPAPPPAHTRRRR